MNPLAQCNSDAFLHMSRAQTTFRCAAWRCPGLSRACAVVAGDA